MGMTQTLSLAVFFIAALAALPWLLRRLQQRQQAGAQGGGAGVRVLSGVAVGPQQRVVTLEVQAQGQSTVLVLGVTAQQVNCLHVLAPAAAFADEIAAARAAGDSPAAGA